eukprot:TRINITY_DN8275_c0_g1_i1.p1 TRINITY_DN8275_c0_g1~~TRINITY_DN8275_c0_g1_i1.p1  ORF type:complete len:373 (-),score=48.76 TRINITY_DN8275_c0_g1_i1:19-1137(-)
MFSLLSRHTQRLGYINKYSTQAANNTDRKTYYREYQQNNKELLKSKKREYYAQNKEKLLEYAKNYNQRVKGDGRKRSPVSKERAAIYKARYSLQNKEKISTYFKEFRVKSKANTLKRLEVERNEMRPLLENFLSIKNPSDWYKISSSQLKQVPKDICPYICRVPFLDFLKVLYPNEDWIPGLFNKSPRLSWADPESTRKFLEYIAKELYIKKPEDWYRISVNQLKAIGAKGMLNHFGRLYDALRLAYPTYQWDSQMFLTRHKKSRQRWLMNLASQILPDSSELQESFYHPLLQSDTSMELDVWAPHLNLGLEYQGEHHYSNLDFRENVCVYAERDRMKAKKCAELGITLIYVPYWWDDTRESLQEIIKETIN